VNYVAKELELEAWVEAGLARLEHYLDNWRVVSELYPIDPG